MGALWWGCGRATRVLAAADGAEVQPLPGPLAPAAGAGAGRQRLVRGSTPGAFQNGQQIADVDLVAELDLQLLDHAGG
jgi:hypothetical protein